MQWLKKTYLYRVFEQSKYVFFIVLFFIFGQLFFTYKAVQTLPFINYGMYSQPHKMNRVFTVYTIDINNEKIDLINQSSISLDFLYYNIAYYTILGEECQDPNIQVLENRLKSKISPENYDYVYRTLINLDNQCDDFSRWINVYLANSSTESIESIKIDENHYQLLDKELDLINSKEVFYHAY